MYLYDWVKKRGKISESCLLRLRKISDLNIGRHQFSKQHPATVGDVLLIGAVVNLLPLAAMDDQVGLLEKVEMVRDGRLGDVEHLHQIADAHLPLILQDFQNFLASFVAQGFAESDHIKV